MLRNKKKIKFFLSMSVLIFFLGCTNVTRFGKGVDITFDLRTVGMQIDDTIMQKSLVARLALTEKKYLIFIGVEVLDGRIFLSGTIIKKEHVLRINCTNHRRKKSDIDYLFKVLRNIGDKAESYF